MAQHLTFSLPLLGKELTDLAGRRRTYIVRSAYAAVLCLVMLYAWRAILGWSGGASLTALGSGLPLMSTLSTFEQIGLQLLLPVFCCGVFTVEKERKTLGLLFLTRLSPWAILFEKLGSRLLLACTFLLISGPVHTFAYALGGITLDLLVAHAINNLVTSFTIISICLLCSAWFQTTTGALLASYALLVGSRALWLAGPAWFNLIDPVSLPALSLLGINGIFFDSYLDATVRGEPILMVTLMRSVPWLLYSLVCLLLARRFLVSRAFVSPRSRTINVLRWIDRKLEGGVRRDRPRRVIVWHPADRLPDFEPIAWRETRNRYLPQAPLSVARLLVLLEILTLLLMLPIIGNLRHDNAFLVVRRFQMVAWGVLLVVTTVQSIGLVTGERTRQALDVLLTSPMKSSDIIRQKFAAVRQMIFICQLPLWTVALAQLSFDNDFLKFFGRASMLLIYPSLVAWIAMAHSLRSRTTVAALIKTLFDVLIRCVAPLLMYLLFDFLFAWTMAIRTTTGPLEFLLELFLRLSPVTQFRITEFTDPGPSQFGTISIEFQLALLFANTLFHGWMLYYISHRCLDRADRLLGRQTPYFY